MMKKTLLLTIIIFSAKIYAQENITKLNIIAKDIFKSDLNFEKQLKDIYTKAFEKVYSKNLTEDLQKAISEIFNNYIEKYKNTDDMILLTCKTNDILSGWALYYKESPIKFIIELICIDPNYWRQGLGRKLIFAIKDQYPEISTIAVVTRKINLISPLFYESLGFKKTNFMLSEYNPDEMQGYELKF